MTMTRTDLKQLVQKERSRHSARREMRDHYRLHGSPNEKMALALAEKGYGVEDVMVKSNVTQTVARAMVLGVP